MLGESETRERKNNWNNEKDIYIYIYIIKREGVWDILNVSEQEATTHYWMIKSK